MALSKEYFHDRLILLLLTVSVFLTVLGSLLILFKFIPGRNEGYIIQYRSNLGVGGYKNGQPSELISFILFLLIILAITSVLSVRVYGIHRQFAVSILAMGVLLMILAIIVSNALLLLR